MKSKHVYTEFICTFNWIFYLFFPCCFLFILSKQILHAYFILSISKCRFSILFYFFLHWILTSFFTSFIQALSKALTEDELVYVRAQFRLLEPNRDGHVSLDNFKMVIYCFTINSCSLVMVDKVKLNFCVLCVRGWSSHQHNLLVSAFFYFHSYPFERMFFLFWKVVVMHSSLSFLYDSFIIMIKFQIELCRLLYVMQLMPWGSQGFLTSYMRWATAIAFELLCIQVPSHTFLKIWPNQ